MAILSLWFWAQRCTTRFLAVVFLPIFKTNTPWIDGSLSTEDTVDVFHFKSYGKAKIASGLFKLA